MIIRNSALSLALYVMSASVQADSVMALWSAPTDGHGTTANYVVMNASPTKTYRVPSKTAAQLLLAAQEYGATLAFYATLGGGGPAADGVAQLVTLNNPGTVPTLTATYLQANLDFTGYLSSGQRDYVWVGVNGGSNGGFWTEVPEIAHMGAASALQDRTLSYAPGCLYLYNSDTQVIENVCNTVAWAELLN